MLRFPEILFWHKLVNILHIEILIYIEKKQCLYHITIPFLIESPEPKISKAESILSQYNFLILSSASVRSAVIRITFHYSIHIIVQYKGKRLIIFTVIFMKNIIYTSYLPIWDQGLCQNRRLYDTWHPT